VTTSLKVAEVFGKMHKNVLRDIEALNCTEDFTRRNFALSTYIDSTGRKLGMYLMTITNITDLVTIENDKPMTTSLKVAEVFGKRHDSVLRDIDVLIERGVHNFVETLYTHPQNGQKYRRYLMDRDGFSLLVMGFTGEAALQWKLKFIAAFNAMEAALRERHAPKPMSSMELLELQFKVLKEVNQKAEEAASEARAAAAVANVMATRVKEIEHKIETNGCAPGFIPMKLAHRRYGQAFSRAVFDAVVDWAGLEKKSYSFTVPETGQIQWAMSVEEAPIWKVVRDFVLGCTKVTTLYYTHPDFGGKRFILYGMTEG